MCDVNLLLSANVHGAVLACVISSIRAYRTVDGSHMARWVYMGIDGSYMAVDGSYYMAPNTVDGSYMAPNKGRIAIGESRLRALVLIAAL